MCRGLKVTVMVHELPGGRTWTLPLFWLRTATLGCPKHESDGLWSTSKPPSPLIVGSICTAPLVLLVTVTVSLLGASDRVVANANWPGLAASGPELIPRVPPVT